MSDEIRKGDLVTIIQELEVTDTTTKSVYVKGVGWVPRTLIVSVRRPINEPTGIGAVVTLDKGYWAVRVAPHSDNGVAWYIPYYNKFMAWVDMAAQHGINKIDSEGVKG